jgi:hypothetical protein
MRMRLELVCITSMLFCASLIISADALAQKSKRKKARPADQSIVLTGGGFNRYRIVLPPNDIPARDGANMLIDEIVVE